MTIMLSKVKKTKFTNGYHCRAAGLHSQRWQAGYGQAASPPSSSIIALQSTGRWELRQEPWVSIYPLKRKPVGATRGGHQPHGSHHDNISHQQSSTTFESIAGPWSSHHLGGSNCYTASNCHMSITIVLLFLLHSGNLEVEHPPLIAAIFSFQVSLREGNHDNFHKFRYWSFTSH